MNLYEIQDEILACVDTDTGEIIDTTHLEALQMERSQKIRNIACWIKNLSADIKAFDEEEKSFHIRKVTAKNKVESLKQYLADVLHGERIKDVEFSIGWRKSQSVEIDDNATIPTKFLIPVPDKIDKISLKEAMKHGAVLPGIRLVEKNNIQIR